MAVASSGPSVSVSGWVAWVVIAGGVAAAATSVHQVWRRVFSPIVQMASQFNEWWPVLMKIAKHYPNGDSGQSLPDLLEKIVREHDDLRDRVLVLETRNMAWPPMPPPG